MSIRNRIKGGLRMIKAKDLLPNPKNFRLHPDEQKAVMDGVLEEVGFAGAALAYETPKGLMLIDGHMRKESVDPNQEIPVLVLDVTDAEADKILATYDPLSAMATTDDKQLAALLDSVETDNEALQAMLADMGIGLETGEDGEAEEGKDEDDSIPAMMLMPYEHYDYIVIVANKLQDFNYLANLFELKRVADPKKKRKIGLGRALWAKTAIKILEKHGLNSNRGTEQGKAGHENPPTAS